MIHWEDFVGNAALKKRLSGQAAHGNLHHAYFLYGPAGSGKRTLARFLTAAYVCTGSGGQKPCGNCPGCRKAAAGLHPDVRTLGDRSPITVAQSRDLCTDAYIRPNEAPRKVYILCNAQAMNASAQNSLLKLLEEGPAYAAFLLLTDNPGALLPTIRSRCESLGLSPVPEAEIEAFLMQRFPEKPLSTIRQAALECEGWIGQAIQRLDGTDLQTETEARSLVQLFAEGNELKFSAFCVSLETKDREYLTNLLQTAEHLLRDALLDQAGALETEKGEKTENIELPGASLPRRTLLEAIAVLEDLRQSTLFYVGTGHLCGALAARLATVRLSAAKGEKS